MSIRLKSFAVLCLCAFGCVGTGCEAPNPAADLAKMATETAKSEAKVKVAEANANAEVEKEKIRADKELALKDKELAAQKNENNDEQVTPSSEKQEDTSISVGGDEGGVSETETPDDTNLEKKQ
jgi:hypothetical protein